MPRVSRLTPLGEIRAIVLDTETTGLDVGQDRLIQIGAVRFAGGKANPDDTFSVRIDPEQPIAEAATAIHGITDAMLVGEPTFAKVRDDFLQWLGDDAIIGQSIGFDLAILVREMRQTGITWRPPRCLDTKLLRAALDGDDSESTLDALAARYQIPITNRHEALGDALMTAEIFRHLLPELEAAGILTIAEAEARMGGQMRIRSRQADEGWYDRTALPPPDPWKNGRDREPLARLDRFLYRHRVQDAMSTNLHLLLPRTTLIEAIKEMDASHLGAAIAGDQASGRPDGIVTERDVLSLLARDGAASLDRRLEEIMTAPVATISTDAFLYRAVAKMRSLGVRRLLAVDAAGRACGLLQQMDLLADPGTEAVAIGENLAAAATPRGVGEVRKRLPALIRRLVEDGVDPQETTAVVDLEMREVLARAARFAEQRMTAEGLEHAPVPWAVLSLGAGGRGEGLIAPERHHAIVYEGSSNESHIDGWFEQLARHLSDILDEMGVPDIHPSLGARHSTWRRSYARWLDVIEAWAQGDTLPHPKGIGSFFDARLVVGDEDLGQDLIRKSRQSAAASPALLATLLRAAEPPAANPSTIDLEAEGETVVAGVARVLAIANGIEKLTTPSRLAEAANREVLARNISDEITELHGLFLGWMIRSADSDNHANVTPSPIIRREDLSAEGLAGIEAACERVRLLPALALSLLDPSVAKALHG
ncbi:MAG: exonuclease domain-containing protein [Deltaproteobacteria bacterium]